jgi:hypothetical protein
VRHTERSRSASHWAESKCVTLSGVEVRHTELSWSAP